MSDNIIRFSLSRNNNNYVEVDLDTGEIKNGKKANKNLQSIFKAIANFEGDTSKIDTEDEKKAVKQLFAIINKDGDETVSNEELKYIKKLLNDAKKYAKDHPDDDYNYDFNFSVCFDINKKFEDDNLTLEDVVEEVEASPVPASTIKAGGTEETLAAADGGSVHAPANETKSQKLNRIVTEKKDKISNTEGVTSENRTVKSGDTLYTIAKDVLIAQGNPNPSYKEVANIIALIVKLNPQIKDVNKIQAGWKLQIPNNVQSVNDEGVITTSSQPVEIPGGGGATPVSGDSGAYVPAPASGDLPKVEVTGKPKDTDFSAPRQDGEFKYWEMINETTGNIVSYNAEITIGNTQSINIYAASLEDLKQMKADIEAELAKIKAPADGEDANAAETRQAANMAAIEKIAELSGNNKNVLRALIENYVNNEDYVDINSNQYNNFLKSMLGTRDYDIIEKLNLKYGDAEADNRCYFRSSNENFKHLVTVYQELLAKEAGGTELTADEASLKIYLSKLSDELKCMYGIDSEDNANLGMFFNEKGKILYLGQAGIYDDIGLKNISASSEESIKAFQEDYKAALKAVEDAEADNKDAVKAEKFKELYKKYANTTDKELALSVLTSGLAKYAAPEDIQAAINSHDAEFLDYLAGGVNENKYTLDNDTLKVFADRASTLYKDGKGDSALLMNLLNISTLLINKTGFNAEKSGVDYVNEIINSYFEIVEDGDTKTYTFKPSRKMTAEEARKLVKVIMSLDYDIASETWNDTSRIEAIFATLTPDDLKEGRCGRGMESYLYLRDQETLLRKMFGEMVERLSSQDNGAEQVETLLTYAYYHSSIPYDKIIEKFGNNNEVMANIYERFYYYHSEISEENFAKLTGMVKEGNNYKFDKTKLPEGITISDVVKLLPDDRYSSIYEPFVAAIFDAMDFTKLDNEVGQLGFLLDKYANSYRTLTNEQQTKLINALKKNPHLVQAKLFQDYNVMKDNFTPENIQLIYDTVGPVNKQKMIEGGAMGDAMFVVKQGDSFHNILKTYLKTHLDKFPRLKNSAEEDTSKWTESRISQALERYCGTYAKSIAADIGIANVSALKVGDIIDLRNVDWDKYQPSWAEYQKY